MFRWITETFGMQLTRCTVYQKRQKMKRKWVTTLVQVLAATRGPLAGSTPWCPSSSLSWSRSSWLASPCSCWRTCRWQTALRAKPRPEVGPLPRPLPQRGGSVSLLTLVVLRYAVILPCEICQGLWLQGVIIMIRLRDHAAPDRAKIVPVGVSALCLWGGDDKLHMHFPHSCYLRTGP